MKIGKYYPSQVRKAIVAGTGSAALLANSFVDTFTTWLPQPVSAGIATAVAIATAVGTFLTKNAPIIDSADDFTP
jgi:hypothetical protein